MQFSIEVLATGDVVFSGHGRHLEPARNVPLSQRIVVGEGVDSCIAGSGLVLVAAVLLLDVACSEGVGSCNAVLLLDVGGTGVLGAAVLLDVSGD